MNATLPLRRLAAGSAALAVLGALAACGSTDNSGGGGSGPTVTAVNYQFNPSTVPVSAGRQVTVTFRNNGTTTHSLTLDDGSGGTQAEPGQSATLTITAPQSGSLSFHCMFHPTLMKGSFTVGGGGAGAGGSSSSSSSTSNGYGY